MEQLGISSAKVTPHGESEALFMVTLEDMDTKRGKGALVLAAAMLFFGLATLSQGRAAWYDIVGITGVQAQVYGWALIVYSIVIVMLYLRGTSRD